METFERDRAIRYRIARGELPRRMERARMWGGHGSMRPCDVCDEKIVLSAVEYEVDLDERTLILCVPCYLAWRVHCGR
jgi:hypothetical protein